MGKGPRRASKGVGKAPGEGSAGRGAVGGGRGEEKGGRTSERAWKAVSCERAVIDMLQVRGSYALVSRRFSKAKQSSRVVVRCELGVKASAGFYWCEKNVYKEL